MYTTKGGPEGVIQLAMRREAASGGLFARSDQFIQKAANYEKDAFGFFVVASFHGGHSRTQAVLHVIKRLLERHFGPPRHFWMKA
jgi:hypothetical protein